MLGKADDLCDLGEMFLAPKLILDSRRIQTPPRKHAFRFHHAIKLVLVGLQKQQ